MPIDFETPVIHFRELYFPNTYCGLKAAYYEKGYSDLVTSNKIDNITCPSCLDLAKTIFDIDRNEYVYNFTDPDMPRETKEE